jgi:hypothetical protein
MQKLAIFGRSVPAHHFQSLFNENNTRHILYLNPTVYSIDLCLSLQTIEPDFIYILSAIRSISMSNGSKLKTSKNMYVDL